MKKSQRLRFYALVTKQSAGTALSADESTEFKQLATLAALHPNASEDTDDTETDEEKKKREDEEKAKKSKGEETDEEKKKREDEEKEKAKGTKPGLVACMQAAFAAAKGGTSAQLVQQVATLTTERDTARTELATANTRAETATTQLSALGSQLSAVCSFLGFASAELAGKDATAVQALLQAKVSASATEQVAALGFNPGQLPAPSADATGTGTKAELRKEFDAITDSTARADFYAKHKAKLLG